MMADIVGDYEVWIRDFVNPFLDLSIQLREEDLLAQMELLKLVVQEQKEFLRMTTTKVQPSDKQLIQDMAKPVSVCLMPLLEFAGQHRSSSLFHHFSAISEGSLAFNWVFVVSHEMRDFAKLSEFSVIKSPAPASFIGDTRESAQYFTNRVLQEFKSR
jgi:adenylyl cyclase-associated protein